MSQMHPNTRLFMDHYPAFCKQFLEDGRSVPTDLVGLAIQDRLSRLFPDDDPADLANIKAYWVDLPPNLLLPGEYNLVHHPSIFDAGAGVYDHRTRVLQTLIFPFVQRMTIQWFANRGVPEECMDFHMIGMAAYTLNLRDTHEHDVTLTNLSAFQHPDRYPRSLFTSPQRNAGILFRKPHQRTLHEDFTSPAVGRPYFLMALARMPVDYSSARPLNVQYIASLSTVCQRDSRALHWDSLPRGDIYVWCCSVYRRVRRAAAENGEGFAQVDPRDIYHFNCAYEECISRERKGAPARRNSAYSGAPTRRDSAYSFVSAVNGPLTPMGAPSPAASDASTPRLSYRSHLTPEPFIQSTARVTRSMTRNAGGSRS